MQNAYGYGLFTGGLGVHYGAEALGATVIPVSGGNTDRQIMLMRDFGITVICCTPSYFLHIIDHAEKIGVDIRKLPLRAGFFGAEPWTEEMRKRIEELAGIKAYDIYGLSEIIGPGVGAESQAQDGLHIFEDHFFPEIVDPKTGESLPDGEEGELVLSTLSKEAMPILRYRTHDITSILTTPSGCGRTIRRIRRINRRSDDMFIIRGVNVFPSQIETAILQIEDTLPHYLIILTRQNNLDQITIQVEVTEKYFSDKVSELQSLRQRLAHAVEQIIGIRAELQLVEPRTLARSEGKIARVSDRRNQPQN
ncbi:MAG TPA: phenylacetate--CoA ligase [Opitutales bacterium]|nr:phenylacetate--CoA ligase [Opitutales bacterium]